MLPGESGLRAHPPNSQELCVSNPGCRRRLGARGGGWKPGLIFAQIVTLYLTPVFYTCMDSSQTWVGPGRHKESGAERLALGREPLLAPHTKRIEQSA